MTTTSFDDQFTVGTQTIVLHQAYGTVAILRRNVADLEVALRKQTERAESYAETLRSIASYVGAGGYNADTVDADVFEGKIRWGIGEIMKRMEKVEAELAKARDQKPSLYVAFSDCGQFVRFWTRSKTDMQAQQLATPDMKITGFYSDPVPAPAVPATCKISLQVDIREMLQWLIDQRGKHGHNHKQSGIWDDDNGAMAGKPCEDCAMYDRARALLQSAKVTDNAAADRLLESGE